MIQLLTVTGARPEAMALCARWMRAQTYPGRVRWVIVHDTDEFVAGGVEGLRSTFPSTWTIEAHRAPYTWSPGHNTQGKNLALGCELMDPSVPTAIIEDDDYYAASYLQWAESASGFASLAGEPAARYYNVATRRFKQHQNMHHASLCSSVVRDEALVLLKVIAAREPKFIDLKLWEVADSKWLSNPDTLRVVGIKGLPGRKGIGSGHDRHFGAADPQGCKLITWMGREAAKIYLKELP